MNAELIAVGTEIILGDIQNTHAQFLSQELAALGINVFYHTAVGDNDGRFSTILQTALSRSDLIFLTGGLGPTTDDITKETACALMEIPCTLDEEIAGRLRAFFTRLNRPMTENNLKQAMVPDGSIVLQNDWGTAPGFILEKDGKTVVLLPGPPRELRPMFTHRVKPYLEAKQQQPIFSKNVRVFGIGESALEPMITDLVESTDPTVALYAKDGEVLVRVTAKAPNRQIAEEKVDGMIALLQTRLGNAIYGIDKSSMQQVLVELLVEHGKTIATAESCTGGMLAAKITEIAGASSIFEMGEITYANRIKAKQLGVLNTTLAQHGAVSEQTACEMARGLANSSNADFAVSITGIAGPDGGTEEKPVGTVYIAVCHQNQVWCERYQLGRYQTERQYVRTLSCLNAMNMVRLTLLDPDHMKKYTL